MEKLPEYLKPIYPFTSHFFKLRDGNQVHYVDEGEGEVVLMIHGNPTWSFYYRNLIKSLSGSYRCVALDNLGCGLSDKPQNYSYCLENHIQNASQLIESLNFKKFHLVVHDWGCAIGMGVAELFPEKIASITIMNGAAYHSKRIPRRINLCRLPFIGDLLVRGLNLFVSSANSMAVSKGLDPLVAKGYKLPYNSWKNRIAVVRFVQDIPLGPDHRSWKVLSKIEEGLSKLNQKKILLLWGKKDFCFTEAFLNDWKGFFKDAEVILYPESGHYVLEDECESTIENIRQFLSA